MVKKCFLIGIGNYGFRYKYSFEKNEEFKKLFCQFMFRLGFKGEADNYFDNYLCQFPKGVKIEYFKDEIWNFKNKDFDVDVFYGVEKIIILVRTMKRKILIKVVEDLFELKEFPEKKVKKVKSRKKKK